MLKEKNFQILQGSVQNFSFKTSGAGISDIIVSTSSIIDSAILWVLDSKLLEPIDRAQNSWPNCAQSRPSCGSN